MLRRRVDGVMLAASLQAQVRRCSEAVKAAISKLAFKLAAAVWVWVSVKSTSTSVVPTVLK